MIELEVFTMSTFLTNDHISINYSDSGQDDRQPVILISGYSGVQGSWIEQRKALLANGYRVITYDRRNHGASQTSQQGLRIARHGQDLYELITHLQLTNVNLVGHSMGAATIWAYLSLWYDQNVSHIITIDESPKTISENDWHYGLLGLTWENYANGVREIETTRMTRHKIKSDIKIAIGKEYRPFDFELNLPLLRDHTAQDWRDVIKMTHTPQLFIAGSDSPLWSADHAKAAQKLNTKYIEAITIDGAGHMPYIEFPDLFNQYMLDFFKTKSQ